MYDNPYETPHALSAPLKHSGLGIASFITSLASGVGAFAVVVVSIVMIGPDVDVLPDDDPALVLMGLGVLGCGLPETIRRHPERTTPASADRKKLFAILGLIFSCLGIFCFGGLMLLGLQA